MSIFDALIDKFSTKCVFDDGTRLIGLHRYALRYIDGDKTMDIGFEISVGHPNCDRIIHADSIEKWNSPFEGVVLNPEERKNILDKVVAYCVRKGYRYMIEPATP